MGLTMRVSNRAYLDHLSANLSRASEQIARLSMQVSSGQRLTQPSDDPLAIGAVIEARADLARLVNRQKVLTKAARLTGAADVALGSISTMLRHALDLTMGATRPGTEATARATTAEELRSMARSIMDEANASVAGDYVFAGKLSQTEPFTQGGGTVSYAGSSEGMELWVAPGRPIEASIPGDRLLNFENASGERAVPEVDRDLFTLLEELAVAVESGHDAAVEQMAVELDALADHVIEMRGVLGARVARIEASQSAAADAQVRAEEMLAETEGVDLVEALIELENQKLAYQSALAATAKLAGLPTLFELQW